MKHKTFSKNYLSLNETSKILESQTYISLDSTEKEWMQNGLDRKPAIKKIVLNNEGHIYYLNFYAVQKLITVLPSNITISNVQDWQKQIAKQDLTKFKNKLTGSLSPFGKQLNINFSIGFWTIENFGENHAFKVVLTNFNDNIYIKKARMTEGYAIVLAKYL